MISFKGKGYINCFYQNCQSIVRFLSDLKCFITVSVYDILLFTETWLNEDILVTEFLSNDFNCIRRDRGTRGDKGWLENEKCLLQGPIL